MVNNPASLHAVPAGLGAGQVGQESTGTWCSAHRQPALTHTLLFPELEGSSPLTSPPSRAPTMANTLGCFCLHPEPLRLAGGHPGGWLLSSVLEPSCGARTRAGPGQDPRTLPTRAPHSTEPTFGPSSPAAGSAGCRRDAACPFGVKTP